MARKTVRVEIPVSKHEEMLTLGKQILAQHQKLGAASPLDNAKMTKLTAVVGTADTKNAEAKAADAVAQAARQVRDVAMGTGPGQSATTKDTGLNLITYARDQLLIAYEGQEEALTGYGFNVVVSAAKPPQRQAKK